MGSFKILPTKYLELFLMKSNRFDIYISGSTLHFLIACGILGISVSVIMTVVYALAYESFRNLIKRIYGLFKRKMESRAY